MDFIQHTINWSKGEILEATCYGIGGLVVVLSAVLFWKFGGTPNSKALVFPLLVAGMFFTTIGAIGVYSNNARIAKFENSWEQNPDAFVLSEKARVEGFDNIFKYSYPAAFVLVMAGAILFFLFKTPNLKAISLGLLLIGLFGYFIDFFAAERADLYYQEIERVLNKEGFEVL